MTPTIEAAASLSVHSHYTRSMEEGMVSQRSHGEELCPIDTAHLDAIGYESNIFLADLQDVVQIPER